MTKGDWKRHTMMDNGLALHFVGFRGDEFRRAECIFGPPDFIHRIYDARMLGDAAPDDVVVFANGAGAGWFEPK